MNTFELVKEYISNRLLRERAAKIEDGYKKDLMSVLAESGEEQEGGHRLIVLPTSIDFGTKSITGIKRQRRVSTSLNEDKVMRYLEKHDLVESCTTTITVINEDAILAANFDGRIPDKDLKSLYEESESFAFVLVDR